ncbi:MAG: hypothetical protein HY516_05415 [Candidatus Aenigmarchaeota archaeon]|nr:hypothetical protein [Candidatus Aenigmarchaeota archaeon]
MKAVTPVIALVMLLLITTSLVGTAAVWFTSTQNSQVSQTFQIINARYGQVTITNLGTSPIASLTATVDGSQVTASIPSPIQPNHAGNVYLETLPATAGDHDLKLLSSSMAADRKTNYPVVKILDIYRCACLVNNMVANFANKNGYPPVQVTCLTEASFSGSYDLSPYNAVVFDGSDCGNTAMSSAAQQNLKNFVSNGGGIIITHDTFLSFKNPELWPVAGISVTGACCDNLPANVKKLVTRTVTEKPYALPSLMSIQCTHTSGEEKTTSEEIFGDIALRDHYLVANFYGTGRSVFTQWGHCAYNCGCGLSGGLPSADEQKSMINALYWVAGV